MALPGPLALTALASGAFAGDSVFGALRMRYLQFPWEMTQSHQVMNYACVIAGGGPAGAMLALVLARSGVEVTLLESMRGLPARL